MTIENKLQALILDRYGSISAFTKSAGIPNSTLSSIMNRGIMNSNVSNIAKICHALNISIDALIKDDGQIMSTSDMNIHEFVDIKKKIDAIRTDLLIKSDLSFNEECLDPLLAADLSDLLELACIYIQKRQ